MSESETNSQGQASNRDSIVELCRYHRLRVIGIYTTQFGRQQRWIPWLFQPLRTVDPIV